MRRWLAIIGWTVVGLGASGCAAPRSLETDRSRTTTDAGTEATSAASAGAAAESPPAASLDAATLAEIERLIADLESLGPVEEAAKQALADELAATQPTVCRALIQHHRALIAYRKQQAARGAAPQDQPMDAAAASEVGTAENPPTVPADRAAPSASEIDADSAGAESPAAAALALVEEHAAGQLASAAGLQFPRSAHGGITRRDESPSASDVEAAGPESARAALAILPRRIDDPQFAPAGYVESADDEETDPLESTDEEPTDADPASSDWQTQLDATIAALEDDLAERPAAADSESPDDRPARLRILYLLAGRRDEALRLPAEMPAGEQEFWSRELFGLSAWLDAGQIADPRRRATEAARHLHDAAASLGALGNLQVRNVAFCKEVRGYGVCTPFERNEFKPREQVILYWEVENLAIESTPLGHRTALRARYQIFDAQGASVEEGEFPVTEETCQNRRRDYFVRYYLWMPERLYNGRHTLKLTVEDALNGNVGQGSLDFTVRAR